MAGRSWYCALRLERSRSALWRKARSWTRARIDGGGGSGAANQAISTALVKLTAEGGKVILALPERGRALVKRVPEPVQIELKKLSARGAHVCREIFAGILVVGLVAIVLGYGRLARGPISLTGLVPTIEEAINGELADVSVKIDDAILQRAPDGPGVLFRLRNIRLVDKNGEILAQAPLAAIGMSGSALLSGRLAPGSVDFIGPRLLLTTNPAAAFRSVSRVPAPATPVSRSPRCRRRTGESAKPIRPKPGSPSGRTIVSPAAKCSTSRARSPRCSNGHEAATPPT